MRSVLESSFSLVPTVLLVLFFIDIRLDQRNIVFDLTDIGSNIDGQDRQRQYRDDHKGSDQFFQSRNAF